MRSYGYTELRPPSNLLAPGALVAIQSREPFQAAIVCGPEASLGRGLQLVRSATSSGTLKKLNNQSFEMDAGLMDLLRANSRLTAVQSITVTLSNATIVEVRDEDVVQGLSHRSRACAAAVRARVEHNYTITMISSGLMGDVTYSVNWERKYAESLSKSEKAGVLSELAVSLGGEYVDQASAEIKSTGLIWGIRDDEYLSALAIPYVDETEFERGTRHIPVETVATITAPHKAIEAPSTYVVPRSAPLNAENPIELKGEPAAEAVP